MLSRKTVAVAAVLLLSGSAAYAAELGAASIVHEQAQSQRAQVEQDRYLAYHDSFAGRPEQPVRAASELPHHN